MTEQQHRETKQAKTNVHQAKHIQLEMTWQFTDQPVHKTISNQWLSDIRHIKKKKDAHLPLSKLIFWEMLQFYFFLSKKLQM
jgi:hypothetical protein